MHLPIYKRDGTKTAESVEIPDALLQGDPNDHAIWLVVRSEEAARRHGNASTRSRSFVRGGGRKPGPQKGRGLARQGTIRSPLNPGGSTIFGPHPHAYCVKVPDKVRKQARRAAFLYKAREDRVRVVEDFALEKPRTRDMVGLFEALGLGDEKVLFLTADFDGMIAKSVRNLPRAVSQKARAASTRELMDCTIIVFQKSAVLEFVKVLDHAS